jgi:hypothetical protein
MSATEAERQDTILIHTATKLVEPTARSSITCRMHDLALWCLALADEQVPDGSHVHLDPGIIPLTTAAAPPLIGREDNLAI